MEANLEAVEGAAFEADLELISHMNNNPSLFIVFSDLKVCDSAACRYSFLQVFDSAGVHFFEGINVCRYSFFEGIHTCRFSGQKVFMFAGIQFCRY